MVSQEVVNTVRLRFRLDTRYAPSKISLAYLTVLKKVAFTEVCTTDFIFDE